VENQSLKGVTIVTGHLGSGKTTFIKEVLKTFPDKKFLVIENEFGEIGIDGEILADDENALVELNNGCICCNIQSDLQNILAKFIKEKPDFDHIIIEATGVANPAKIAREFVPTTYLGRHFNLTSVICVLDNINLEKHRKLPEFELQFLTSDTYYVSKVEKDYKKVAEILAATFEVSVQAFQELENVKDWFFNKSFFGLNEKIFDHDHDHDHSHSHHHYQKVSFEIPGEFDPQTLEHYLNILFMQYNGRLFRCKGLLHFRNYPEPVILQGVFDAIAFDHMSEDQAKKVKAKVNQIVLIGEDLNAETIETSFRNCIAEEGL
jgi:G3E family GTPase